MKRKKINMFLVIIILIIFVAVIGLIVWKNKNREKKLIIEEYTPQEEISYEQLRTTNIVLYYLNKNSMELGTEIRQIDSKELLEKPENKLLELLMENPESEELKKLIPDNTKILDLKLESGILTINFSGESISKQEDDIFKLMVESIKKTTFQLNEINSLEILIEGEKIK